MGGWPEVPWLLLLPSPWCGLVALVSAYWRMCRALVGLARQEDAHWWNSMLSRALVSWGFLVALVGLVGPGRSWQALVSVMGLGEPRWRWAEIGGLLVGPLVGYGARWALVLVRRWWSQSTF